MAWRDLLLTHFGPGLLGGVTFGKWWQLLRQHHFAVAPDCLPRAAVITCQSMVMSLLNQIEQRHCAVSADVEIPPPIFLLGHWRHGTTHLHNLLTLDQRFAFPNNYQALFPSSFLTAGSPHSRILDFLLPNRRPMDNVEWTMGSPQEDEFALCIMSGKSPCMGWVFPQNRACYDRYLTMCDVPAAEVEEWKAAFLLFVRKLTWLYQRPLILKSPPHTARIRLLLEMFPDARFIHIRRNPYAVFASTRSMLSAVSELHRLQRLPASDSDDWILQTYSTMYDAFFEQRSLIPAGQFHELSFEQLEQDPVGEVHRIYESLQLPDVTIVQGELQSYVSSIAAYQKNRFADLDPHLRSRIAKDWRRSFDLWGYSL